MQLLEDESRKKETKNTEPARNVALEELIKIIPGEVKKVNTFFFSGSMNLLFYY